MVVVSEGSKESLSMPELRVSSDWSYRGLRVVTLENRFLRLTILPEAGAKIWQITYKPFDVDLLWNNPRIGPSCLPPNSRYDDVWSGGRRGQVSLTLGLLCLWVSYLLPLATLPLRLA